MSQSYPLISCICITNNRPKQLEKAIACFATQNYPNKELVISYPKNDLLSKQVVENIRKDETLKIMLVERPADESLGNARNHLIAKCLGDYVCIWDDDDWYHPSRITYQFNSMQIVGQRYEASVLSRIFLYDATTKKVYYSFPYTWDGTILCRKEMLLQNQYANANRAEDTHVITFLSGRKLLYRIEDAPFLYIYIYHGTNTWDYKHFEHFMNKSELLDQELTDSILKLIDN
ncbi:glycosyltransferase family 2 protein [Pedobacter sp. WC2423]|uniref:glycosyltransferase family 2 protein n=1 Tax=Pedobacter sp. WC2423 TaxID=3234142 RepID=UPI003465C1AE